MNIQNQRSQQTLAGLTLAALLVSSTPTFAASPKKFSMQEAQALAETTRTDSDFPIVMNEFVLEQLNYFVGTKRGRKFVRLSLQRMEAYRTVIEEKLNQYQVPYEIMAIPLIESGFQNFLPLQPKSRYAGLWSFHEATARNFGLRVDQKVDERLNVERQTDAAMRYLLANQIRFKDWLLGILAYNRGEGTLQNAIEKFGTRDPWALMHKSKTGDRDYLAKVMAVALILKNPKMVN